MTIALTITDVFFCVYSLKSRNAFNRAEVSISRYLDLAWELPWKQYVVLLSSVFGWDSLLQLSASENGAWVTTGALDMSNVELAMLTLVLRGQIQFCCSLQ